MFVIFLVKNTPFVQEQLVRLQIERLMALSKATKEIMASFTAMQKLIGWRRVQLVSNEQLDSTPVGSLLFQTIWMFMILHLFSILRMI